MAVPILRVRLLTLVAFLMIYYYSTGGSSSWVGDQIDHTGSLQLMTEALEWQSTMSVDDEFSIIDEDDSSGLDRRSLYWRARPFYISYGALAANRIPCPARSGRSYYTHNCHRTGGAVNPYQRGCSRITRCRR